jgi:Peptidase family S41
MADGNILPVWAQTTVACGLIGLASFYGVGWLHQSGAVGNRLEQEPVELEASILEEPNDYVADIRAAAQLARERWSYAEHRLALDGVDLDANEAAALRMLGDEPTATSFYLAITFFVAGLHDGHSGVLHTSTIAPYRNRWPFSLTEVSEGIMVNGLAEGLEGVSRGDLILAVDDRPIEDWIREAKHRVFSSTDSSRRRRAITKMASWDNAETRRFEIQRPDGTQATLELPLPYALDKVSEPVLVETERTHRMLDEEIAYFRPGNFSPPPNSGWPGPAEGRDAILAESYAAIDAVVGELKSAKAFVLDLRGNPGGTDLLGQFLVDRFVDGDYIYYQLSALGKKGWRDFHAVGSSAPKGKHSFAGNPIAVLIDNYTFSTADNAAAALEAVHPNAIFVGRPNGAGTGAPRPFILPRTDTKIYFCTQRVQTPSGRMGEGISIQLDLPVTWTREDVLQGRDPDLAAAIAALAK